MQNHCHYFAVLVVVELGVMVELETGVDSAPSSATLFRADGCSHLAQAVMTAN